jgi:hypothetical protein
VELYLQTPYTPSWYAKVQLMWNMLGLGEHCPLHVKTYVKDWQIQGLLTFCLYCGSSRVTDFTDRVVILREFELPVS